jgi:enterochelin esterase-like enzyme
VWLEGLDDWSWPGRGAVAVEALPPAWVPSFPRPLERAVAASAGAVAPGSSQRQRAVRLGGGVVLSALAVAAAALALKSPLSIERLVGVRTVASTSSSTSFAVEQAAADSNAALPTLAPVSQDAAGSSIDAASYSSAALHGHGSFIVYLPPGYAASTAHYPVLYLLHGNDQQAGAFLQIGLQSKLDQLIAAHKIPPLIAVMIQGGRGANNWAQYGGHNYESYVVEVQNMVDRMLPTVADRAGRAIAGDSMGGFGAMHLALTYPSRFGVVESWLGFFNGLEGQLKADRPILSALGLRAFLYGGSEDTIANPGEDGPFAAALRSNGARAKSAIYPGGHSLETIEAHLEDMLVFAGHALAASLRPSPQTAKPRAAA